MEYSVFIAHADGERDQAEKLVEPLRSAGYEVNYPGAILVGESILGEAQRALNSGGPVVICATCKAVGTTWIRRLSRARQSSSGRLFVMQMEPDADIDELRFDEKTASYFQEPQRAIDELVAALNKYYPLNDASAAISLKLRAEQTYRRLVLESCDLIQLANLPTDNRIDLHNLALRKLYVPLRLRRESDVASVGDIQEIDLRYLDEKGRLRLGLTDQDMENVLRRFSIGGCLRRFRQLVVLGDPGAGKSTLLQWIATAYLLRPTRERDWKDVADVATLPDFDWLPILIRCRDLSPAVLGSRLDDILGYTLRQSEMPEQEAGVLSALLKEKLVENAALLLVDGLDEIPDASARIRFSRQLEQFCIAYPDVTMVITSRVVGYREMGYRFGRGVEHFMVDEFLPYEKDQFIRRWCAIAEPPERQVFAANELIRDVHSTERIERLTGNPMLLTTMALVKRKIGALPQRRADLYSEATQVLLNWRRTESKDSLDIHEALPQLCYLAYTMCENGVKRIRHGDAVAALGRFRKEYSHLHEIRHHSPEKFLSLVQQNTGLLVEIGRERYLGAQVSVYEFRHLTFQEYLAAVALVNAYLPKRSDKPLAENVMAVISRALSVGESFREPGLQSWFEVLRLCLAWCHHGEVDSVLKVILEPSSERESSLASGLRIVLAALCLADEPSVSNLLAQEILVRLVARFDSDRGEEISIAVAELKGSRWADQFRKVVLREFQHRKWLKRESLVVLYGQLLEKRPLDVYVDRLASQTKERVVDAALAIAHLSDTVVEDWNVKLAAKLLLRIVQEGGPISHAASYALYELNTGSGAGSWSATRKDWDAVAKVLRDSKADPCAVQELLHLVGTRRALGVIGAVLARTADSIPMIREAAARSLGALGGPRARKALLKLCEDRSNKVRTCAKASLRMLAERAEL